MLGAPYREPEPRCVLTGQPIERRAPLELYYRGRPVRPERASELSPLLAFLRGAVAATGSALEELWGAGVGNAELRAILAERGIRELTGRLLAAPWEHAALSERPASEADRAAG